jgi:hypothetical protein
LHFCGRPELRQKCALIFSAISVALAPSLP